MLSMKKVTNKLFTSSSPLVQKRIFCHFLLHQFSFAHPHWCTLTLLNRGNLIPSGKSEKNRELLLFYSSLGNKEEDGKIIWKNFFFLLSMLFTLNCFFNLTILKYLTFFSFSRDQQTKYNKRIFVNSWKVVKELVPFWVVILSFPRPHKIFLVKDKSWDQDFNSEPLTDK